jgi:pimeloyl-ACP methyl ester carboxylesterase
MAIPDLNGAEFSTLTLGRQLAVAREALTELHSPVLVMGSSLGGYLAALMQAEGDPVFAVVLMAPAFDFARRLMRALGKQAMAQWRVDGKMTVYHQSERAEREVGIGIIDEGLTYSGMPEMRVPCVMVHGVNDVEVPIELSRLYARDNAALVRLVEVEDDHTLMRSMSTVLRETAQLFADGINPRSGK